MNILSLLALTGIVAFGGNKASVSTKKYKWYNIQYDEESVGLLLPTGDLLFYDTIALAKSAAIAAWTNPGGEIAIVCQVEPPDMILNHATVVTMAFSPQPGGLVSEIEFI